MVTMPLVPPYSSTTTANGVCVCCMLESTSTSPCVSGTNEYLAPDGREIGQRRGVGIEEQILGVEVADHVVERVALSRARASTAAGARTRWPRRRCVSIGSDATSTRGTITIFAVRPEKRMTRRKRSCFLSPRGCRGHVGREDAEDLVFGERRFAVGVEGQTDELQHGARSDIEHPEPG